MQVTQTLGDGLTATFADTTVVDLVLAADTVEGLRGRVDLPSVLLNMVTKVVAVVKELED